MSIHNETHTTSPSKTSRSNILAKLKKEVSGADYTKLPEEVGYQYPVLSKAEQKNQFISLLEANHAEVITLEPQQIPTVIAAVLKKRGINTLLGGKDSPIEKHLTALANSKDNSISVQYYDFNLFVPSNKERLFNDTPASISSAHSAIAATGSIVLWPTEQEPRSLSLVPPVHIVLVEEKTLQQDFASLIKVQQWHNKMPTNIVLVSGPSKTADIQQTLAYGAHGPKELIVLLVP